MASRERPILFSGPMVRAILKEIEKPGSGKTQTRRLPRRLPEAWEGAAQLGPCHYTGTWQWQDEHGNCRCTRDGIKPTAWPGDHLWVRETHAFVECDEGVPGAFSGASRNIVSENDAEWFKVEYVAELRTIYWEPPNLRPSIHMPRWASRISLEVTGVRVERLQEITEEGAKAEGVTPDFPSSIGRDQRLTTGELVLDSPDRSAFAWLWDEISGDRATWKSNPWVWVIEFRPYLKREVESC